MPKKYDVIIIGAGVVGSMVARFLSKYKLDVLLIDKEVDVGMGTSSANTAAIHAGYNALPGTNKAIMNVISAKIWPQLFAQLGVAYEQCGDYVIAFNEKDMSMLKTLLARSQKNDVPDVEIIDGAEMRRREPKLPPGVIGALWVPGGGICDPFATTVAAAENAVENGVELKLGTAFEDFIMEGNTITGIRTNQGDFECRWVVNAAGLYADEVMHKAGVRPEFKIRPRRGEYVILDKADFQLENNTILFPTPSDKGKGIVISASVHGNVIVGPNANFVEDKTNRDITPEGLEEIWEGGKKLIPGINRKHIIAQFGGCRATGNADCPNPEIDYHQDFIIEIPDEVKGLVNLGGIESPGLSSSPGIALRVIEMLQEAGEALEEKADWNPIRKAPPIFRHLSKEEQAKLIEEEPAYGRIVCRCETVTEGEILTAIHSPIPATTYDAIKRRTWLGTGRCQGGFDMPRVVNILSRELGIPPEEVTKKGASSPLLFRRTKEVQQDHLTVEDLI